MSRDDDLNELAEIVTHLPPRARATLRSVSVQLKRTQQRSRRQRLIAAIKTFLPYNDRITRVSILLGVITGIVLLSRPVFAFPLGELQIILLLAMFAVWLLGTTLGVWTIIGDFIDGLIAAMRVWRQGGAQTA